MKSDRGRSDGESLYLRNATAEEKLLLAEMEHSPLPAHIAVIMDGNRRWARERSLPAIMGHRAGVRIFRELVRACSDLGVRVLTAYAFSLENWKRPQREVGVLMHLFEHYSRKDRAEMLENGVCFRIIGHLDNLPDRVRVELEKTAEATRANTGLILNLAVNYGSRSEILEAARLLADDIHAGRVDPARLRDEDLARHLFTAMVPDPDLLIRTSGEMRVSNFMLWQMAYSEFWFTERYWPDFRRLDLLRAMVDYQRRERRYGGDDAVETAVRLTGGRRVYGDNKKGRRFVLSTDVGKDGVKR